MTSRLGVKRSTLVGHVPLDEEADSHQVFENGFESREVLSNSITPQIRGYTTFDNPPNRLAPLRNRIAMHHSNMALDTSDEYYASTSVPHFGPANPPHGLPRTLFQNDIDDPYAVSTVLQAANYVIDAVVRPLPRDNLDKPLLNASHQSLHTAAIARGESTLSHNGQRSPTNVAPGGGYMGPEYSSSPYYEVNAANGDLSRGVVGSVNQRVPSNVTNSSSSAIQRGAVRPRYSSTRSVSSSIRSSSVRGSTIVFRQINYVVSAKKMPWSKPVPIQVLSNVSGIMSPGLNAIMGPTGSGKSSLLDVLAARKDPRFLRGEVLVDGSSQPDNFKCVSGYVVQDDIIMGTLTVRENLRFSAALRLPDSTTNEVRNRKVQEVIEELNLTKVADRKIGTELIRGVSGGERKRTNIGMELITDPSVLFLDEPTTGLDAFTAGSVVKTLRNLAARGRTVILSIHQPKYSIYKLFDNLTIVCSGRIVYHGRADRTLHYFKEIGYHCEAHNSPPDFFMDILHGEVKPRRSSNEVLDQRRIQPTAIDENAIDFEDDEEVETQGIAHKLIAAWSGSVYAKGVEEEVQRVYEKSLITSNGSVKVRKSDRIEYRTSFYNQLIWVSWRTALNLLRNPQSSVIQLIVYLFFGLSIGTVYVGLDRSTESGVQNRNGLFFFLVLQMVFVNLGAIEVFIKERVAFIHENSSGFYRVSVYFLAKIFCDMLPIKALPAVLFMPIVYWMAGLRNDAGAFFFYELNLLLSTTAACGVAFFVSASVSVFGIANIIISIIYVFMMVFGGFLINVKSLGTWLSWCRYFSIFRYSISGMSINEFSGLTFCSVNTTVMNCESGNNILQSQGISYSTPWDLWCNELGLLLITAFFCFICYVQLRRINKYK